MRDPYFANYKLQIAIYQWARVACRVMASGEQTTALIRQLPPMGVGFILVALYWGGALAIGAALWSSGAIQNSTEFLQAFSHYLWTFVLITLVAWAYWLYCVYAFHKVLAEVPGWRHPTAPGKAVWLYFILGYNFYWMVKWPSQVADFVNWRTGSVKMPRWLPGTVALIAFFLRFVESGLGTALIFGVGVYLSHYIKLALLAQPPLSTLSSGQSQKPDDRVIG